MRTLVVLAFALLALTVGSCQSTGSPPSAATVVERARATHGSPELDRAVVSFNFRGDQYRLRHDEGRFHYRRTYTDSVGRRVTDGLTNDSTYRQVEGEGATLSPSEQESVRMTVNSVSYFALLPEPLNDPAVQAEYSGRDTIEGVPYHRIRVTFQQEGGGTDWEDEFMYWFRTDNYAMEYLAYAFGLGPNEEMGTRFRKAYNERTRQGVRFADYYNYTVDTLAADQLSRYPDLWKQDAVELVSRVEIDSVRVRPL